MPSTINSWKIRRRNRNLADHWGDYLNVLRTKWFEIPLGNQRVKSTDLDKMGDDELLKLWQNGKREQTEGDDGFSLRGWYHLLYKPILKGKKVLDVGSGAGVDGITFAQAGADVTFLDVVQLNLKAVRRLCEIQEVKDVDFVYLKNPKSLDTLGKDYDVFWCQGSQITTPFGMIQEEDHALLKHMKPGGRWIELAYPRARWERGGSPPFETWGALTDGGAPWMEWYDLEKMMRRLAPEKFRAVLYFEFRDSEFNWFDLVRFKA